MPPQSEAFAAPGSYSPYPQCESPLTASPEASPPHDSPTRSDTPPARDDDALAGTPPALARPVLRAMRRRHPDSLVASFSDYFALAAGLLGLSAATELAA